MSGETPAAVLVRHGSTEWAEAGRHTGRTDIPLDEKGRAQARRLGARLAGATFVAVLTSPLSRARETCALAGLDADAVVVADLAEWDYGDYDGLTSDQIHAERPDWSLWRDGCPGGEQPADVSARADRVVARLRDAGGPVAVFAHGHVLRVVGARWVGLGPDAGAWLGLGTASLSRLGREKDRPALTTWNDTAHLEPWAASAVTARRDRRR